MSYITQYTLTLPFPYSSFCPLYIPHPPHLTFHSLSLSLSLAPSFSFINFLSLFLALQTLSSSIFFSLGGSPFTHSKKRHEAAYAQAFQSRRFVSVLSSALRFNFSPASPCRIVQSQAQATRFAACGPRRTRAGVRGRRDGAFRCEC